MMALLLTNGNSTTYSLRRKLWSVELAVGYSEDGQLEGNRFAIFVLESVIVREGYLTKEIAC